MANVVTSQNIDSLLKSANYATARTQLEVAKVDSADMHDLLSSTNYTEARSKLGITSSGFQVVPTIAELKALASTTLANGTAVEVLGYHTLSDAGGGVFYWDSTSTAADNNGTIFEGNSVATGRWLRVYDGYINVKWFGAKGDNSTNDTVAIEAAIAFCISVRKTLYFPESTYRCNLVLNFPQNLGDEGEISWLGEQSLSRLSAFNSSLDTVKFNVTGYVTRCRFENLEVAGGWHANAVHYSVYSHCRFTATVMAHCSRSFGNVYNQCCFFGGNYGYVGVSTSSSYAGFHTFNSCEFKADKVAYYIDNRYSPANIGNGCIHNQSDWEAMSGLAVLITANVGGQDIFNGCWWEAVGTSGTINISDLNGLPYAGYVGATNLDSGGGNINIPSSSMLLYAYGDRSTKIKFNGNKCKGFKAYGDIYAEIDILASGNIERHADTPNATQIIKVNRYASYSDAKLVEAHVDTIDHFQALTTNKILGGISAHKTEIVYDNNVKNRFVGHTITDLSGVIATGDSTIEIVPQLGSLVGRAYKVTLKPNERFLMLGWTGGNAQRITNYQAPPSGGSFRISTTSSSSANKDLYFSLAISADVALTATASNNYKVKVEKRDKSYKLFTTDIAWLPYFQNKESTDLEFYITDIQWIDGLNDVNNRARIVDFLASNNFAGFGVASLFQQNVQQNYNPYNIRTHLPKILHDYTSFTDRTLAEKDIFTGLPLGSKVKIGTSVNNGSFAAFTGTVPNNWSAQTSGTGTITTSQITDGPTGSGVSLLTSSFYRASGHGAWLKSGISGSSYLKGNKDYFVMALVKCDDVGGKLHIQEYTDTVGEILATYAQTAGEWRWVFGMFNTSQYDSYDEFALSTNNSTWLIDQLMFVDYSGNINLSKY